MADSGGMAVASFGVTKIDPRKPSDVVFAAAGATLDGDNVLQVNYNNEAFTAEEGKERLILALRQIMLRLEAGDLTWPAG